MADRVVDKPERQRIRTLAQAAMNADVTVEQLTAVIGDMGDTIDGIGDTMVSMNAAIEKLDATMNRMAGTLDAVDAIAAGMAEVVSRLERVVARVEAIVEIGEVAARPIVAIESVGRSLAARLGLVAGS